jgi:hypothetical protein
MLPANRDDRTVHVQRVLDVEEDDLLDVITAFAAEQDLEIDRRQKLEGLVFRRMAGPGTNEGHLFKRGDALQVVITEVAGGYDVELVADLRDTLGRKAEDRRRGVVRSGALAALFAYLGVRGLTNVVGLGDFILLGISAMFGRRAAGYARRAPDDFDKLERNIANELNAVLDKAAYS